MESTAVRPRGGNDKGDTLKITNLFVVINILITNPIRPGATNLSMTRYFFFSFYVLAFK